MIASVLQKRSVFLSLLLSLYLLFGSSLHVSAQGTVITGVVTNPTGEPLQGASVVVKGTSKGVATDSKGNFSLTVTNPNAVLVVTSQGFARSELALAGKSNVTLTLLPESNTLDQVVVIGYGTASKRDLTGSITKISGKEIADKPNVNPVASLQGKVAGLSVVNSGRPGQEPDLRIRGTISIGSVKPLYVVDGVFNDNIDYINPNDIESIEVLKDPSSLAIFGVRGAAGVIAITTKKAKAGQVTVNFNSNVGIKKMVDKIKLVNAEQFKMLYNEQLKNEGAAPFDFSRWNGNTDWIDALSQTGVFNTNNISILGSTEKNRFYMNVGYMHDEGIAKYEKLDKLTFSMNDEFKVSKLLKIGFNFNGIKQNLPYDQPFYQEQYNTPLYDARRISPVVNPFNEQYGVYSVLPGFQRQIQNPLLSLENNYNKILHTEYRTVSNVFVELTLLKNFTVRSTVYADLTNGDRTRYFPRVYNYDPSITTGNPVSIDPNYTLSRLNVDSYKRQKFQQDHILTYKKNFGEHGLTAIAGWTTYYNSESHLNGSIRQKTGGDSIPDNKRFWYLNTALGDPQTRSNTSDQWERTTASGLFRALYNYGGKYFINASYRRDASSVINDDYKKKWQSFYAVGAAWELTRENFMGNQKTFDFLKLKASWGILGNQNTYDYNYPFYPALVAGANAVFGNNIFPASSQAYLPDPNLHWETVNAKELGVEFNMFNNRLHFEAAYYDKRTDDLLSYKPAQAGAKPGLSNIGSISNKGLELQASWTQQLNRDVTFTASGNFTTIKNKVISLYTSDREGITGASEEYPNRTAVGFPIGFFYGFIQEGVYQTQAEVDASPKVNGFGTYG
ncbi:MAG TPA: SusC/RagA family TonB-linked outer membrane protein, partial [Chitinophagaceae bacterium]|nr:SusC/RagA family TonB-linked outer membrane protein [Chitinophagaceae bacterium]